MSCKTFNTKNTLTLKKLVLWKLFYTNFSKGYLIRFESEFLIKLKTGFETVSYPDKQQKVELGRFEMSLSQKSILSWNLNNFKEITPKLI